MLMLPDSGHLNLPAHFSVFQSVLMLSRTVLPMKVHLCDLLPNPFLEYWAKSVTCISPRKAYPSNPEIFSGHHHHAYR